MALFGKSTTKKDENKKPSEKAATKAAKVAKVSKAPKAKKAELKAPVVAKETKKEVAIKAPAVSADAAAKTTSVIIAPHITEKANVLNEKNNIYAFKVVGTATKHAVVHAIKKDHKVTPIDVRFVTVPGKTVIYRGRYTFKSGFKKAYVSLKKGDKIDFAA